MTVGRKLWCWQQWWLLRREEEDSREGAAAMEWKEFLCRNSCVRRWLWRSAYDSGSTLVMRLVTKSLNSPRRPRNTYRLKSLRDIGRPATANSSNNDFACCIYILTDESPWRRSWKEPWSCMMRELDGEASTFSRVRQTQCEVEQSTTRCNTSTERERRVKHSK